MFSIDVLGFLGVFYRFSRFSRVFLTSLIDNPEPKRRLCRTMSGGDVAS